VTGKDQLVESSIEDPLSTIEEHTMKINTKDVVAHKIIVEHHEDEEINAFQFSAQGHSTHKRRTQRSQRRTNQDGKRGM